MLFDLLWPLISPTVIVYLLSVCLPAGVEAWAGPNNEGQPQPELAWAARAVAVGDPLLCLLVIVYGSRARCWSPTQSTTWPSSS